MYAKAAGTVMFLLHKGESKPFATAPGSVCLEIIKALGANAHAWARQRRDNEVDNSTYFETFEDWFHFVPGGAPKHADYVHPVTGECFNLPWHKHFQAPLPQAEENALAQRVAARKAAYAEAYRPHTEMWAQMAHVLKTASEWDAAHMPSTM